MGSRWHVENEELILCEILRRPGDVYDNGNESGVCVEKRSVRTEFWSEVKIDFMTREVIHTATFMIKRVIYIEMDR